MAESCVSALCLSKLELLKVKTSLFDQESFLPRHIWVEGTLQTIFRGIVPLIMANFCESACWYLFVKVLTILARTRKPLQTNLLGRGSHDSEMLQTLNKQKVVQNFTTYRTLLWLIQADDVLPQAPKCWFNLDENRYHHLRYQLHSSSATQDVMCWTSNNLKGDLVPYNK